MRIRANAKEDEQNMRGEPVRTARTLIKEVPTIAHVLTLIASECLPP